MFIIWIKKCILKLVWLASFKYLSTNGNFNTMKQEENGIKKEQRRVLGKLKWFLKIFLNKNNVKL